MYNSVTMIEAARMVGSIDFTIDTLKFLSHIPTYSSTPNTTSEIANLTSSEILDAYNKLTTFESEVNTSAKVERLNNFMRSEYIRYMRRLINTIEDSGTIEEFEDNFPSDGGYSTFISELTVVRDIIRNKMNSTVEQEKENLKKLEELGDEAKSEEKTLKILQEEFQQFIAKRDKEIEIANNQISRLRMLITETQQNYDTFKINHEKSIIKENNSNNTTHESKIITTNSDIRKQKEHLNQSFTTDRDLEIKQRIRRNKYYNDWMTLLDTYDTTIEEKTNQIKELEIASKADEDELRFLTQYYHRIDWNLRNEREEEARLKQEQDETKAKWDRFANLASLMKATWRGRKQRIEFDKLLKKARRMKKRAKKNAANKAAKSPVRFPPIKKK